MHSQRYSSGAGRAEERRRAWAQPGRMEGVYTLKGLGRGDRGSKEEGEGQERHNHWTCTWSHRWGTNPMCPLRLELADATDATTQPSFPLPFQDPAPS